MAPQYKLHYFESQGRGEAIRLLLAYGNIKYEDIRYSHEEFLTKVKPTLPFGQLPVLEVDGVFLNQSTAIARYLGQVLKLTGKTSMEDAQADAFVATLWDIGAHFKDAMMGKPEALIAMLPNHLKQMDLIVQKNKGHITGGRLTWADFVFASLAVLLRRFYKAGDYLKDFPNLAGLEKTVNNLPGVKKWIAERPFDKYFSEQSPSD